MVDSYGIVFALLAAVGWGSYFVPVKKIGIYHMFQLQGGIGIGAIIFALAILPLYGSPTIEIYGISAGIIWVAASLLMMLAVKHIGLAKASPIDGSLVIITSFLWGLLFFREIVGSLLFAVIGLVLLVVGLPLITVGEKKLGDRKGYIYAASAGLLWGAIFVPIKLADTLESTYFSMAFTIFVIGMILLIVSRKFRGKEVAGGTAAGVLWNAANLSSFVAISSLGLAIGYPLTQLAILIAAIWGLVYFKEVTHRKSSIAIYAGVTIVLIGSAFLALSSP
jgi:glucose uptake protein